MGNKCCADENSVMQKKKGINKPENLKPTVNRKMSMNIETRSIAATSPLTKSGTTAMETGMDQTNALILTACNIDL